MRIILINDIDLTIYCGIERDYPEPATAHIIQKNLGINSYLGFDISNACHGFCDAIILANSLIKTGMSNILIVTAEAPSYVTKLAIDSINKNPSKFNSLFGMLTVGDASAAMLVSASQGNLKLKITNIEMQCNSKLYSLCYYHFPNGQFEGQMVMDKICAEILSSHRKILKKSKTKHEWNDPDFIFPHQVGRRPHLKIAKMFNLEPERLSITFPSLGNITSATIPANIANWVKNARIQSMKNI